MSHSSGGSEVKAWALTGLAIIGSIIFALVIVQFIPVGSGLEPTIVAPGDPSSPTGRASAGASVPGIRAVYTAGNVSIERRPPFGSFALAANESIDPVLPPGPFEAVMTAEVIAPGGERSARFGAEIMGGTLEILHNGALITRGTAASQPVEVWSDPIGLPVGGLSLEFRFTRDGDAPTSFRPLWRPEGGLAAHPLPASDPAWLVRDRSLNGLVLAQNLNCASCHAPQSDSLRAVLDDSPAPMLGDVGARINPGWMRMWLTNPHMFNPDTPMPQVLTNEEGKSELIADLTQYLVSLGGPIVRDSQPANADIIATGMVTYHQIGCVSCHGPLEQLEMLPGARPNVPDPTEDFAPLQQIMGKMPRSSLASFLKDPVRWHPSGRMPSLNLTDLEAQAVAAYLTDKFSMRMRPSDVELDPVRIERGKEAFVAVGCASCHTLGENHPIERRPMSSIPFESLAGAATDGCIAPTETPRENGQVMYSLSSRDRTALKLFLEEAASWITDQSPARVASASLVRMNCLACHTYADAGGPERAVAAYFESLDDADLGDEGRIPPTLSHIGSKLNAAWMREVLENAGVARPYMATRMPQFGTANVEHLPETLRAASGVTSVQDDGPTHPEDFASIGRHLVGIGGFNCIQCHSIAGRAGVNVPGPDLALAPERLRHEYFERWILEPSVIHPGTRMPSYFIAGMSPSSQLGGDPDQQVNAMWAYLSQGEALPLPDGLPDPGGFAISVEDDPVVFRTFMSDVGSRAIAVGYPEKIHVAFDADKARLAMIWMGDFLNAQGAWGGRGGTVTDPQQEPIWVAPKGQPFIVAQSAPNPWPETVANDASIFHGYELDEERRPTFLYELRSPAGTVEVREKPVPGRSGDAPSLLRHFALKGPPGAMVWFNGRGMELVNASVEVGGIAGPREDGAMMIPLDPNGEATFEVKISW